MIVFGMCWENAEEHRGNVDSSQLEWSIRLTIGIWFSLITFFYTCVHMWSYIIHCRSRHTYSFVRICVCFSLQVKYKFMH